MNLPGAGRFCNFILVEIGTAEELVEIHGERAIEPVSPLCAFASGWGCRAHERRHPFGRVPKKSHFPPQGCRCSQGARKPNPTRLAFSNTKRQSTRVW